MKVITGISDIRRWSRSVREEGQPLAFVPTLGCLHGGHMTLVREARQRGGAVAVSVFVNPIQFRPPQFRQYPRNLDADAALCEAEGVDVVFAPAWEDMYPGVQEDELFACQDLPEEQRPPLDFGKAFPWGPKKPALVRTPRTLVSRMDGKLHPWHFDGVCTVVARLFEAVDPTDAYFGAKDPQQVAILKRLNAWLGGRLSVHVVPTVRDADGVPSSSRNTQLSPAQREVAREMSAILRNGAAAIEADPSDLTSLEASILERLRGIDAIELDFFEVLDAESLEPASSTAPPAQTLLYLAYYVDGLRLTDTWLVPTARAAR